MSAEQNKQTALKMIATLAEGRLDESLVTPDIAWWVPGRGRVGKADFLALADAFAGLMEGPVTMKVHGVTAEGDRVAVEAESYGKLKNGKICYSKEYNDSKHAADVLGF